MYTYTVILDKSFEPSNQEQRTEVAEYIAIYESKSRYGMPIGALDLVGMRSGWDAKFTRISSKYIKVISITDRTGKIIYQDFPE